MKLDWSKPHHTLLVASGVISLLLVLPNLGKGLQSVAYVTQAVPIAYAAKETAEQVDDKFQRYLERQDAVADALNKYVTQQQQVPNQAAPRVWVEPDLVDGRQVCTDGTERWWYDETRGCE